MGTRSVEGQGLAGGRGNEGVGGGKGNLGQVGSNGQIGKPLLACLLGTLELTQTLMSVLSA